MAKIDKGVEGLLANIDQRCAQIRELEREVEKLEATIRVRDNQIKGLQELQAMTFNQSKEERDKVAKLNAILAGMDDKAVKAIETKLGAVIVGKDREIADLRSQLARAEGWIDALIGNHPTRGGAALWRGSAIDKARTSKNVTMGIDPGAGDNAVFAWKDSEGWHVRPATDEEIPF